jgi:hypothetical protein
MNPIRIPLCHMIALVSLHCKVLETIFSPEVLVETRSVIATRRQHVDQRRGTTSHLYIPVIVH